MTLEQRLDIMQDTFSLCATVMEKKGKDSTFKGDCNANFKTQVAGTTMYQEWAVLVNKHYQRLMFAIAENPHDPWNTRHAESIEDSIHDIINYMVILKGLKGDHS